ERKTGKMQVVDPASVEDGAHDGATAEKQAGDEHGQRRAPSASKPDRSAAAQALQKTINKEPGAANIEVIADDSPAPLAPNQVTIGDAKKFIAMTVAAKRTQIGQSALRSLGDLGVELTFERGKGSFWAGKRINIDPSMSSDPDVLAGILAHEAHH